jgi:hypothetical protein
MCTHMLAYGHTACVPICQKAQRSQLACDRERGSNQILMRVAVTGVYEDLVVVRRHGLCSGKK